MSFGTSRASKSLAVSGGWAYAPLVPCVPGPVTSATWWAIANGLGRGCIHFGRCQQRNRPDRSAARGGHGQSEGSSCRVIGEVDDQVGINLAKRKVERLKRPTG